MRKFCSMELVRLIARASRREAALALGLPATSAGTAASVAGRMRRHGTDGVFMARLQKLARELSTETVQTDYRTRRQVLQELEAVPWDEWCSICKESTASTGHVGGKNRYAAVWLWEELTLSDYRLAAGLRGSPYHQRYVYSTKFVTCQLAEIEEPLRRYGEKLIAVAA
jgi:hypothetical protein